MQITWLGDAPVRYFGFVLAATMSTFALCASGVERALEIAGVTVTPHMMVETMRYRVEPEPAVGARVQLFLRNRREAGEPLRLDSNTQWRFAGVAPGELLESSAWAWHDIPGATSEKMTLPSGALTVLTFNSRVRAYGPDRSIRIKASGEGHRWLSARVGLERQECWLSAVTFLAPETALQPNRIVVHVANASRQPLTIVSARLWIPSDTRTPRVLDTVVELTGIEGFNGTLTIPAGDRGGFTVSTAPLPLTYTALQVQLARPRSKPISLWGHVRIKPERFDISGGWVNGRQQQVTNETFLKTLKRLHVNTAHIAHTPGYSDTDLYSKYPLKYFNKLMPLEFYDTDEMLPRIHAVEFLGEPQYGGGRPVPPQEVWEALRPYVPSRLATTVTHSEERIWRDYAGLSDYPHYDAYRVTAPSADAWRMYDRWDGLRIGWGAPLETIGDMCRSLRELNRPMPCAIWSQGPHEGWEVYGGRQLTSPTADEIRVQAYHAISTRITSLYWFNLSLESLVKWRDTLDELARVGRELRMIDDFLLEGDAYTFERLRTPEGRLDWDLATVCGPKAALLFALDLDYVPDTTEKVFRFGPPRSATWRFRLPAYLSGIADVFRLDADGIRDVDWKRVDDAIEIRSVEQKVAVFVASPTRALRSDLEAERRSLLAAECELQIDPAHDDADFERLSALISGE